MPAAEDWPAISSSKYGGTVEYEIWPTFHIVVTTGDRVDVFLCILEHNRALGRILYVKRHEWLSCRTRMMNNCGSKVLRETNLLQGLNLCAKGSGLRRTARA